MRSKRTISVILSAVLVSAGANMFVSNAASVQPDISGITSESNVGRSDKEWEKIVADLEDQIAYLNQQLNRTRDEYEEQLYHTKKQYEEEINNLNLQLSRIADDRDSMQLSYKKQISELESENSNLSKQVSSLTTDKTNLSKQVASLTAEKNNLSKDFTAFKDSIDRLDANDDGSVNAVDASLVLSIYAYNSTNNPKVETLSDYFATFIK